ncbi:MAG: hypothetical protein N3E36_02325 [Sulfolobales archaeon]|nr:hypothetical protein [Sulfolobales archaeon]
MKGFFILGTCSGGEAYIRDACNVLHKVGSRMYGYEVIRKGNLRTVIQMQT